MKIFFCLTFLIFLSSCLGDRKEFLKREKESFYTNHPTCQVRVQNLKNIPEFLTKEYFRLMSDKNWKATPLTKRGKLLEGDTYFVLDRKILDKRPIYKTKTVNGKLQRYQDGVASLLYKDCEIRIEIRRAKLNRISSTDKVFFKGFGKRSEPRVTFEGNERCVRALKESFMHIPHCKVQGN